MIIEEGTKVHAGLPHTEDYDEGTILEVGEDGRVYVAWSEAGERYWEDPASLSEGHPGLWRAGTLCDLKTGEAIRPATEDEARRSRGAGNDGAIKVDGRTVFVDDEDDDNTAVEEPPYDSDVPWFAMAPWSD